MVMVAIYGDEEGGGGGDGSGVGDGGTLEQNLAYGCMVADGIRTAVMSKKRVGDAIIWRTADPKTGRIIFVAQRG